MAYCVSPKSLVSISLPSDELPAFFNVSPTIIILDLSALPYQIKIEEANKSLLTETELSNFAGRRERQNDFNTPFLRAWTKILPSTESAKRIPSGFSRVTMYSFKFILKDEPLDIAKILTVRSFSLRLVAIVDRPLILIKHVSVPQNEEEVQPPPSNGGDERARALQLGSCRMNIFFFFFLAEAPRLN